MASSPDEHLTDTDFDSSLADEDVRWPLVAKVGVGLAVVTLVGMLVAVVVAAFVVGPSDDDAAAVLFDDAVDPLAPVAFGDGFLYAERSTGQIVHVQRGGPVGSVADDSFVVAPFAMVPDELAVDGQRGLLGLAVRDRAVGDDEVYASWTRAADGRLVVGRLGVGDGTAADLVWEGPASVDFANGGTLAVLDDELLIGIGELQAPDLVDDPSTPNGKVLALDPDGPVDQEPRVVASGFHNPYALTVRAGEVWVADNAPGAAPERLVRIGPGGATDALALEGRRAPSGLAVGADGDLLLCGFVSGVVERIALASDGGVSDLRPPDGVVDGLPCATGVTVLADGSVVTTTADAVWRA